MSDYFDRDGNPIDDASKWAEMRRRVGIRVAATTVGDARVSTVWLGLDHNYDIVGDPIIFETMVFDGSEDGYCERYATELDAMRGHLRIVETLQSGGVL